MRMPKKIIHACWKPETAIQHLPQAYKNFYDEWKNTLPQPVHYKATEGRWQKDPKTGEITRVNNVPLELKYPDEVHHGLWGGEAVVKGYRLGGRYENLVPRWWVPKLKKTVFYSEVLDQYLEMAATERAVWLVHRHFGLDSYLLENRACDIVSLLGLRIKRNILLSLVRGTLHSEDPDKRNEMLDKYKSFIIPEEDAVWYGLSVDEALQLHADRTAAENPPRRLKETYRKQALQQLQDLQLRQQAEDQRLASSESSSWMNKLNPFGGKTQSKS